MEPIGRPTLGLSVDRFLRAMHRYDAGRTLPLLHASRLTTPQIAALEFTREPRPVSDIAAHLGLSRPATSQMIDKLADKRLVLRTEGAADRRQRYIVLSAGGRALVDRIASARAARFDSSLAVLDAADAARFGSILEEVIARLDARTPTPARPSPRRSRKR